MEQSLGWLLTGIIERRHLADTAQWPSQVCRRKAVAWGWLVRPPLRLPVSPTPITHVVESRGASLDAQGRALLEEDLRSPCTEEITVFQAFSRVIREAGKKFVVMDTAPTGHPLLLLDASGAYHREIARQMSGKDLHFTTPMILDASVEHRAKLLKASIGKPLRAIIASAPQFLLDAGEGGKNTFIDSKLVGCATQCSQLGAPFF